jgi:predicted FMN-binding regulatory protein PaiB
VREARSAALVTATEEGLVGTPLPVLLEESEGQNGLLYAHVARANPQWKLAPTCEAMAIFTRPQAYVTPSWYAAKQETHRIVPTWNYVAIHANGPVEFFDDTDRLLDVVARLTNLHEQERSERWVVTDAPARLHQIAAQGDRRAAHADHEARWQAEDEPEPQRCRSDLGTFGAGVRQRQATCEVCEGGRCAERKGLFKRLNGGGSVVLQFTSGPIST